MYEYKIKLNFKIENCATCPFRNERIIHDDVQSLDRINGVVGIVRISSICPLKDEPILMNEPVESYNSKCPLKGNVNRIPDGN